MTNTNVTWNLKIAMINRKISKVFFQTILRKKLGGVPSEIFGFELWVTFILI